MAAAYRRPYNVVIHRMQGYPAAAGENDFRRA